MPALSVITVCFRAKEALSATIDSLLQQTWTDFEYLIMANFFPGQLCRVKILADQIIITPETPSMSPEHMCH